MGNKASAPEEVGPPPPDEGQLRANLAAAVKQLAALEAAVGQLEASADADTLSMLAMNADEVGKSIEELASMLDKNAAPPAFSPDSQIRLHLVDKGSPNACVFDDIRQLQAGEEGALTLRSHRGLAICGRHPEQRRAGPWRYIEATAAGPQRSSSQPTTRA